MFDGMGDDSEGAFITSAAAERNAGAILAVLERVLPCRGELLEIASGSGQHAVYCARALPGILWQPSDPSPRACGSIHARATAAALGNLCLPRVIDVRDRPWPLARADAVVAVNLLHIAPWSVTEALFAGAAAIQPADAPLVVYGPFLMSGQHTADSNAAFDEQLRQRDPAWGVRDREAVAGTARGNGYSLEETVTMPANNHILVFRRSE